MHFLWYDTETAGLDATKSPLLTAFFAICDKDLNIIDTLDMKVKPESLENMVIEKGALDTNKIDIVAHLSSPDTLTYKEAGSRLSEFLYKHKIKGKQKSYMQAGHNLSFDQGFVYQYLMPKEEFEKIVHYRVLDTSSTTTFLKDVGVFPEHLGSLTSLVAYFEIPMGKAHTAKDDVLMNIEVYRRIRKMMAQKKTDVVNIDANLLSIIEA